MNYYPKREQHPIDPEVATLMDESIAEPTALKPTTPLVVHAASAETNRRSIFEQDFERFTSGTESWRAALEKNMLKAPEDIPSDYRLAANTDFSPYCSYLVQSLQLIKLGSPLLLCREARDVGGNILDYLVSVYEPLYANTHIDSRSPAEQLVLLIDYAHFFPHYFEEGWRERTRGAGLAINNLAAFEHAKRVGLAERAFMTSTLIRYARREKSTGMDKALEVYEKFASEVDENNKRRFTPLTAEEFGGLVNMWLKEAFGKDPTLNDRFGLSKTFPAIEP